MSADDIRADPCPKCGNPSRLFTPNAQRVPYTVPRRYEAAWQCTKCGHLTFVAPRPEAGLAAQGTRTVMADDLDRWRDDGSVNTYADGVAAGRQEAFREMRRFLLEGHTPDELWAWLDAKSGEAT